MMLQKALVLGEHPLSLEDVYSVAAQQRSVELSSSALERIEKAHTFLLSCVKAGKIFYGVNTGFGLLSNVTIPHAEIESLQYNLLRSHACGVGEPLGDPEVRAMLLLRASALAMGHSGVSVGLVQQILALLNRGVVPVIPQKGSVGASGDLAPLSHLALVLIGEGKARYQGQVMSGAEALQCAGLQPIRLGPKEGLALINGTQFMAALGVLNLVKAERLCDQADLIGAMSLEAMRGTSAAFDPDLHAVRPHPGQIQVAARLRKILLSRGVKSEISLSHEACDRVQDPYSLRCMPQVHGATRDALAYVRQVIEREINSVTDNPLVFPDQRKIVSGGNFHGQVLAIALDTLAIAIAELANISERRIEKLTNPSFSGLPAFLTSNGGLNSGFMIVQVSAASLVSENKTLCHPASVDSIPTSADKEDHVSMGAWGARKAAQVLENTQQVLGFELLAAAQGIDFLRPLRSSEVIESLHALVRKRVPRVEADRNLSHDFLAIAQLMDSAEFHSLFDGL